MSARPAVPLHSLERDVSPPRKKLCIDLTEDDEHNSSTIPSPFKLLSIRNASWSANKETISLNTVLRGRDIKEAWIFNFHFDIPWFMQHFDEKIRETVPVKVVHGNWDKTSANRTGIDWALNFHPNVKQIITYMPDRFGTHHTKMFIIFRGNNTMQVTIHTANMIANDWDRMTEAAWQSPLLPLLKNTNPRTAMMESAEGDIGSGTRFKGDLIDYLSAYKTAAGTMLLRALIDQVFQHDFSEVKGALIASAPSREPVPLTVSASNNQKLWGHQSLQRALAAVPGLSTERKKSQNQHFHTVAQVSSIATLPVKWFNETLLPSLCYPHKVECYKNQVSIIFPTASNVRNSADGYTCGGSIHLNSNSVAQKKQIELLKPRLHQWCKGSLEDADSQRGSHLPHIKTYIRFNRKPHTKTEATGNLSRTAMNGEETSATKSKNVETILSPDEANLVPKIDWALLTSANLSQQAWGQPVQTKERNNMSTDKTSEKEKVKDTESKPMQNWVQSYELGVLVWPELWQSRSNPVKASTMVPVFGADSPNPEQAREDEITIGLRMPYDLPLTPYSKEDEPWAKLPDPVPDSMGRTWPPTYDWLDLN